MKKAFLIKASVMTRIVVDVPENYNLENENLFYKMYEIAKPRLQDNIVADNIEKIEEDTEVPYDSKFDVEWN